MFILLPVILYYCDIINYTYQMLNYAKKLSFLKSSSDLIFAHFNQNKSEDIISYRFSFKECFFSFGNADTNFKLQQILCSKN